MGKSHNRQLYFDKFIKDQPTPEKYMEALKKSPYQAHRNAATGLSGLYINLSAQRDETTNQRDNASVERSI